MKAALKRVTGIKSGADDVEIHPCDACSLKIVKAERKKKARETPTAPDGIKNDAMEADVNYLNVERLTQTGQRHSI